MRVLITGASGFAGGHLALACRAEGAETIGVSRSPGGDVALDSWACADLTDPAAATAVVRDTRPDRIFHLAAKPSVAESWRDPSGTIEANLASTVNLLEAVALAAPGARVLVAGSGEQYGPVPPERLPVTEDEPLRPQNPYAVSKCATDLAAGFYADARGIHVVRTRSFNHAGPGQHERHLVSSVARQIAAAEAAGHSRATVHTGDTRVSRDFTDVRDVSRAYWLALDRAPAGVYNVCSGRGLSVADVLAAFSPLTQLEVDQHTDTELLRDNQVMEIRGSHDRITEATGWSPRVPVEQMLEDTLAYWRRRLRDAVAP